MQWIDGKPTGVGLWIIKTVQGDYIAATVEEFDDDGRKALMINSEGESEELDARYSTFTSWSAKSFGPIPEP